MEDLNSKKRIAIRRYHNQLKVTSNGVLILGLWSIFKVFLTTMTGRGQSGLNGLSSTGEVIAFFVMFFILLGIDIRFRLSIWRGARKEAYGRNANNIYLVLTILLIILSGCSIVLLLYAFFRYENKPSETFVALLLEVTSFVIMCELVYAGFKIRKIRSESSDESVEES